MKYRIPLPLLGSTDDPRLDIVDPVWSPQSRALAQHGLGDVEASTNAVMLALFDDCVDEFSFVDVGAGVGVSSMLCARFFRPARVVAIESTGRAASMIRRISAANELDVDVRTGLSEALDAVAPDRSLVVRVGTTVDASDVVGAVATASGDGIPPIVIEGDRDRTELVATAEASGYDVYPLRRFPSWRPLRDASDTAPADGWLLVAGRIPDGLRERHLIWAGALGACTPDRNDRTPFMAELRSGFDARHGGAVLLADARRDLSRGARAIWDRIDPWLPSPTSRTGRLIGRAVLRARRLLPPPGL